jgi:hypothetical protein
MLTGLPYLTLPTGAGIAGMFVTNTTYVALSMLQGDRFAKQFGGVSGNDPDWFKLTTYGSDSLGNAPNISVNFCISGDRFSDNSKDYIVDDWRCMDLAALAGAQRIYFNVSSFDVGLFGLNPRATSPSTTRGTLSRPSRRASPMASVGVVALAGLARRRRAV